VNWNDRTSCRARRIAERLVSDPEAPDIVVLNETFEESDVVELASRARERYPYQRLGLPRSEQLIGTNGGLSILSRYPIESLETESFGTCNEVFGDCLATKGIIHALIRLSDDLKINVVATHLDAGQTPDDRRARRQQLTQIRDYLRARVDRQKWPTLLMGDFNVDGLMPGSEQGESEDDSEYSEMLGLLGHPRDVIASLRDAWPFDRAGTRELNTINCAGISILPCRSPNHDEGRHLRERLDYILLYGTEPLERTRELVERGRARLARARSKITTRVVDAMHLPFRDRACGTDYLSDHQAVAATLELVHRP
jgi:endonuclease/exonuclease/phosphatase family metal-dependent hydrolase